MKTISLIHKNESISFGNHLPFVLIAGPCLMESKDHALMMAESLSSIAKQYKVPFVFKTSFDKANRTSIQGARGLGLQASLEVFSQIRSFCPVITDVHCPEQCSLIKDYVDILQIPAFLCRQTDLLKAAAETGKIIQVKKGQFLAPWDMRNIVNKLEEFGNQNILLCERGVSFGYNTLVSDMRSLPIMAKTGYPVIFDATHSVQQPGGQGASSGGQREFAPILARAALSTGIAGIFAESHNDPDKAPSDGPNMIPLKGIPQLIEELLAFDAVSKKYPRYL